MIATQKYQLIEDIEEAKRVLGELSRYPRVAFDTETYVPADAPRILNYNTFSKGSGKNKRDEVKAFDPHSSECRLFQFATPDRDIYLFDLLKIPVSLFKDFLESGVEICGQNLVFDLRFLLKYDIRPKKLADIMIFAQVVEAGLKSDFGLDDILNRVLGIEISKEEQASDWSGELTESQLEYAATDVEHLLDLRQALFNVAKQDGLLEVLALEMQVLPVLAEMEYKGVHVDIEASNSVLTEFSEKLEKYSHNILELCQQYEIPATDKFLNSPKQLLNAFSILGLEPVDPFTGKPTTSRDVISQIRHPFVDELNKYRKLSKLIGTYLEKFPVIKHPLTNMIHASYTQTFTDTARLSSKGLINIQNIPSRGETGKRMRGLFTAPPGKMMLIADYSMIEIRVMAMMSKDPIMCTLIMNGVDIHDKTTEDVLKIKKNNPLWTEYRNIGKMLNFAVSYGVSSKTLSMRSNDLLTEREAEKIIKEWFKQYGGYTKFMHRVQAQAINTGETRTLLNRRRLYRPEQFTDQQIARQAGNCVIQSSSADIMKSALVSAHRSGLDLRLTCHDELVAYADPEHAEFQAKLLEKAMVEGAQKVVEKALARGMDIESAIPITAEAKVTTNWRDKSS